MGVDCQGCPMMNIQLDGRDVVVTLRDDVWQLEEPGTLYLTRTQAQILRRGLNSLDAHYPLDAEPEDG
jgi:hypothetical protein